MDFHGIDLNLLAAFDALMSERNVTRAAKQVGVSQPAMSAALSRLRLVLKDPLFVRGAGGLQPTARARELALPIGQALRRIEEVLTKPPEFIPAEATHKFSLGLSDYPAAIVLPGLLDAVRNQAPGVVLNVQAFSDRDHAISLLDGGQIDAAIGVPPTHPEARILTRPILKDTFVTILANDHPMARRGMDMATYLSLAHILVSPEGGGLGIVDHALAQEGRTRNVALTLPHMFVAPSAVARTQMTATLLRRVALSSAASGKLALFPPPLRLPAVEFHLIWHKRTESSSAQQWLRQCILDQAELLA